MIDVVTVSIQRQMTVNHDLCVRPQDVWRQEVPDVTEHEVHITVAPEVEPLDRIREDHTVYRPDITQLVRIQKRGLEAQRSVD